MKASSPSPPDRRRTITMFSTKSRSSIASSAVRLSGMICPTPVAPVGRDQELWPRASSIRSRSDFAENPPNTTECGAPILAQASIAMAASGIIGR